MIEALWMKTAEKEIGVKEAPGSKDNPRVREYHAATSMGAKPDATPWCSSYVNWVLKQSGVKGTGSAWARDWLKWGVALQKPQYGCIAVYERNGPGGDSHACFWIGEEDGFDLCLGGNQNDSVCIAKQDKRKLLGYRWPVAVPVPSPTVKGLDGLQEGTVEWYRAAFKMCAIDKGYEDAVRYNAKTVLNGKARYQKVAEKVGIPWWVIGCIHFKEASCNFAGVLHNGEKIIGTGKKTILVPKGRGPFSTWEEAAIDALTMNGSRWAKVKAGSKDIGELLYAVERYNGTGYISGAGKAETSPYLWARSNINDDKGKYVADGKFDPNATTQKTTGFAVLIKELEKMGEIQLA